MFEEMISRISSDKAALFAISDCEAYFDALEQRAASLSKSDYELEKPKKKVESLRLSGYLFESPSLLRGLGRLLDIGALFDLYNTSQTPAEADARALYSDWRAVGRDLQTAIEGAISEAGAEVERRYALR
ncbi:MAG: hypothetical protein ACE5HK_02120 [Candidatus Methylomirabilales bacterium]